MMIFRRGTVAQRGHLSPIVSLAIACFCILLSQRALADDTAVIWARNYGLGSATATATRTTTDSSGNVYVIGSYTGATLTLGGETLTRRGPQDGFVAKLDTTGTVTWARNIGGAAATTQPQDLALDGAGNVHVVGHFAGGNLTDGQVNEAFGAVRGGFVIQYNSSGARQWSYGAGDNSVTAQFTGVAISGSNVHIVGNFSGGDLNAQGLLIVGTADGFIMRFDSSGTPVDFRQLRGPGATVVPTSIAVSGTSSYVGGHFDGASLTSPSLARIGGVQTGFMLRYNSSFTNNWTQAIGGTGGATVTSSQIAVDGSGNVTFAGTFSGAGLTTPTLNRLSAAGTTGFVLNAQPTGATTSSFNWAKNLGSAAADTGVNGVAVDGSGNAYITGSFSGGNLTSPALGLIGTQSLLVARLAAADGDFAASAAMGGTTVAGSGVSVDASGNAFIAGTMTGSLTAPTLTAIGNSDALLVRYGPRHTLAVAKAGTGTGTVTADSGLLACGPTCSDNYARGSSVTLTATATAGSTFAGWSVDCSGAAASTPVTMSVARSCTATFTLNPAPPAPTPTPAPPTVELPINTAGSGQGSVSLAAALGNPGPNATYTVQQTSGAALPAWLTFDPATISFSYNVPLPGDLPIQPAAAGDTRAARPAPPNLVYPLAIQVQTVPVALTVNGQAYVINMDFYAPRPTVAATALSYSATGRSGDGASGKPAVSWDGGQVLFETSANNLFGAISAETKIARYHGLSGKRDLLSQTAIPGGGVANASNGPATAPAVSANGAFGVFAAAGGGVTLNPTSPLKQIYRTGLAYPRVALNEAATPAPVMVSTTPAGVPANAPADRPAISEDGTFIAFESAATNLGWNQGGTQIWLKNTADGSITAVSANAQGIVGNGDSRNSSLSGDGRFVAFESTATNLVAGAAGQQVYLKDMATGAIFVLAPGSNPKVDARATSVVFVTQGRVQRFDVATGRVTNLAAGDQPSVSADGRFVAWRADGTNGFTQIWVRDVFRNVSALVSQTAAGVPGGGNSYDPALSGDGASIAFGAQARDLVNGNPAPGQIHLAGNPLVLPARTAHWYVPAGGNQAWAIERWGDRAYVANLAYQPNSGPATWVAGLCAFADLGCKGTLNPGPLALATWFPEQGQAVASVNGGTNLPLQLYAVMGPSTTAMPGLPQSGWWYDPATIGSGVFLQFATQTAADGTMSQAAHLSLLTRDAQGLPVWYAAEGRLGTDLGLEATLYAYAGGAPVGLTTGGVAPSASAIGIARLSFAANDHATLRLPDGSTRNLARFRF